jgi:Tol biopolymer transport system component
MPLLKTDAGKTPHDWSRDGRYLAYTSRNGDVWALPLPPSADTEPLQVTATPFVESNPRFSPDGRWIAYQSNESGVREEVLIQSFPLPGPKRQVSSSGGVLPRWSHDGKELFYVAPDLSLMSVSIASTGSTPQIGTPVRLFQSRAFQLGGYYDVSPDGRFLLNVSTAEQIAPPITVVLNWAQNLNK